MDERVASNMSGALHITNRKGSAMNVHQRIEQAIDDLEELIDLTGTLAIKAAKAESDFKVKAASLRIGLRDSGKFTVQALDDEVQIACEDEHLEMLLAQAKHQAARDAMRGLQAQLDGLRTLAAGSRGV